MNRSSSSTPPWWQVFLDAIDKLPRPKQALSLASLTAKLVAHGERETAAMVARRAWQQSHEADRNDRLEIRRALSAIAPRYHAQISTDAGRIATWQAALTLVVRPGMLVLEVGSGSGILAMLAARAGAVVVSCEKDPLMAAIAEDAVRINGFAEKIKIISKSLHALRIPQDVPSRADVLMLDLFSDTLLDFRPFEIIRATKRLLGTSSIAVPARVSLRGALAEFRRWNRMIPGSVAGFDLGALRSIAPIDIVLDASDPDLLLRSNSEAMIDARLPDELPAPSGAAKRDFISNGGVVNGMALWLYLELAPGHVLEARPGGAPRGFYAKPRFFAFDQILNTQPGQTFSVDLRWEDRRLTIALVE